MHIFVAENFRGECLNESALLPDIEPQTGLPARLFKEGDAVPLVLYGHLWKKQPAIAAHAYHETVPPNLDFFHTNGLQRGENAKRYLQAGFLNARQRIKAGVIEGSRPGRFRNGPVERNNRKHVPNTAAKLFP